MMNVIDSNQITEMYSEQNITPNEIKYLSDKELDKTLEMYKQKQKEVQQEIDISGRYPSFVLKSQFNDLTENISALEREKYRRKTEIEKVSSRTESVNDVLYQNKKLSSFLKKKIK